MTESWTAGLIERRMLLGGAAAGLLLPGALRAAKPSPFAGFTHGVASGEPSPTSMLFWTRFVGAAGQSVPLKLELSTDPRMAKISKRAELVADPERDHTGRVTVTGLQPGKTYYYRFIGPQKTRSDIGRTRTLPEGAVNAFRMGVFSCSNLPFGYFNAYAHAVQADDIDLFVHLGDYLYEYPRGTYPDARETIAGRTVEPAGEMILKGDYWQRYQSYRADPDLQAMHGMFPSITVWDDHEFANDAWKGGAENHDPAREGSWTDRVQAAKDAYRDWMPVSDALWAKYEIGRLATLFRLETRITGRDQQLDLAAAIKAGPSTMTAIAKLRDEQWLAGNRQMLGLAQEKWLFEEMAAASRRGARWQVLAQQVIMGKIMMPADASVLAGPNPDPRVAAYLGAGSLAAKAGLPLSFDAWDGYPAARARLLANAQSTGADLVVLAGDSHNAWAIDLVNDGRPAGVEFAGTSVTSPGFEEYLRAPPATVAASMMQANPTLRWADMSQRGYMQVVLTPVEAVCEWRFTAPVASRQAKLASMVRGRTTAGQRRLRMG